MIYKIDKITHANGDDRVDGRYPARIGSVVNLVHLGLESCMTLGYIKDNQGNDNSGYLMTSPVECYSMHDGVIKVVTLNSIYYLSEFKPSKPLSMDCSK